jgi:hypothetical protein
MKHTSSKLAAQPEAAKRRQKACDAKTTADRVRASLLAEKPKR